MMIPEREDLKKDKYEQEESKQGQLGKGTN